MVFCQKAQLGHFILVEMSLLRYRNANFPDHRIDNLMVRRTLKPVYMRVYGFLMRQILALCPNFAQVNQKKNIICDWSRYCMLRSN